MIMLNASKVLRRDSKWILSQENFRIAIFIAYLKKKKFHISKIVKFTYVILPG